MPICENGRRAYIEAMVLSRREGLDTSIMLQLVELVHRRPSLQASMSRPAVDHPC